MIRFASICIIALVLFFGLSYSGMVVFGVDQMDHHGITQDLECVNHCISAVVNQILMPMNTRGSIISVVVYNILFLVVFIFLKNYFFVRMDSIGIYLRQKNFQTVILRE